MRKNIIFLAIAFVVTTCVSGCSINVGNYDVHSGNNGSSTLGNISVADGRVAGQLDVTNGNVQIGSNAKVKTVEVVNGNIEIADFSQATSLDIINGNIKAGNNVTVSGNVETVNGDIQFEQGGLLGGHVETVNGDIILAQGSSVAGDIIMGNSNKWFSEKSSKTPKLKLADGVTIGGQIHLYRHVELSLSDSINPTIVKRHYDKK